MRNVSCQPPLLGDFAALGGLLAAFTPRALAVRAANAIGTARAGYPLRCRRPATFARCLAAGAALAFAGGGCYFAAGAAGTLASRATRTFLAAGALAILLGHSHTALECLLAASAVGAGAVRSTCAVFSTWALAGLFGLGRCRATSQRGFATSASRALALGTAVAVGTAWALTGGFGHCLAADADNTLTTRVTTTCGRLCSLRGG
jgi:hypothetical protein